MIVDRTNRIPQLLPPLPLPAFWHLLLVFAVFCCDCVRGERPQIGHYPFIGDMWRSKPPWTMRPPSPEFQVFIASGTTAESLVDDEPYRTYYFSLEEKRYENIENDDTVCSVLLENAGELRMNSSVPMSFQMQTYFKPLLVYFVCDDMCCSAECCERDWTLTIAGYGLLGSATAVIVIYFCIYLIGFGIAGRNGKLCGNTDVDFDMRGSCAPMSTYSTSNMKFSSNNCDDDVTKV